MEKITSLLETANKFSITIDTDTLGYYWYKVELMSNICAIIMVIIVCVIIGLSIYFTIRDIK